MRLPERFFPEKKELSVIAYFPFSSDDSLGEWKEKVLRKKVKYSVISSPAESYVRAVSNGTCSSMYHTLKLNADIRPVLSWKWRVVGFPEKKYSDDLKSREEDDFAARMYVIFPALFFANSRVLEYIWAQDLGIGTISSSPYSDNIKLIVLRSGPTENGAWKKEERDIYEDYVSAFHARPKYKIGAVAFMCDSDSTGSSAEAHFDDIKIFIKK